jgi:hypothetical protein
MIDAAARLHAAMPATIKTTPRTRQTSWRSIALIKLRAFEIGGDGEPEI